MVLCHASDRGDPGGFIDIIIVCVLTVLKNKISTIFNQNICDDDCLLMLFFNRS